MKVFISWSGEESKAIATLLGDWISDVLQGVEPWISSEDIDKGSLWMGEITDILKDVTVGVLCLTQANFNAPWILFEAGALSRGLAKNRVCPFLINLSFTDLRPPLANFNATKPDQADMLKLIQTINNNRGNSSLSKERVEKSFGQWWPQFEASFATRVQEFKLADSIPRRSTDDMIVEVLELSRSLHSHIRQQPDKAEIETTLKHYADILTENIEDRLSKKLAMERFRESLYGHSFFNSDPP